MVKGSPLLALLLLFFAYAVFGWEWFHWGQLWHTHLALPYFNIIFWSFVPVPTLFVIGVMTAPLAMVRSSILKWFQSDTRSFIATVAISFFAVILLVHLDVTLEVFLLVTAALLARLELQDHQWNEWLAFWTLSIVALGGLGLGMVGHWYLGSEDLLKFLI